MRTIEDNLIIELKYVLRDSGENGEVMEVMDEHWPLKFFFGSQTMLPAFENNLRGLTEGASFAFTLAAKDAYGQLNPALLKEVALKDLPDSQRFPNKSFEKGDRLVFDIGEKNESLGTVTEVLSDSLLVDFNHALAGKDLHFSGQVLYIRAPRKEELDAERYIEPNGIRSDSRLRND